MNDALVIARLVQFAAAMAAFGASAFRFYAVGWLPSAPDERVVARFDLWNRALLWISGLIMLLSGIAIVPLVAARMAGEESAAVDPATIETVLSATEFGHRWCWHLLFTLLLIVSAVIVRRRHALNLLWAALALASLGWVGHAAGASGWAGLGRELNQSIHLLAARAVARRLAAARLVARTRTIGRGGVWRFRATCAAGLLADGVRGGRGYRDHRDRQHIDPGRQCRCAVRDGLRPAAVAEDLALSRHGSGRSTQQISADAAAR